jgi:hypothetical protein
VVSGAHQGKRTGSTAQAHETVAQRNNRRTADGDWRHPSQPSWTEQGFEVGVGPSVVVADHGVAKSTTTTVKDKVYAFIFDQKGAMYALGIQGNKITKIKK